MTTLTLPTSDTDSTKKSVVYPGIPFDYRFHEIDLVNGICMMVPFGSINHTPLVTIAQKNMLNLGSMLDEHSKSIRANSAVRISMRFHSAHYIYVHVCRTERIVQWMNAKQFTFDENVLLQYEPIDKIESNLRDAWDKNKIIPGWICLAQNKLVWVSDIDLRLVSKVTGISMPE